MFSRKQIFSKNLCENKYFRIYLTKYHASKYFHNKWFLFYMWLMRFACVVRNLRKMSTFSLFSYFCKHFFAKMQKWVSRQFSRKCEHENFRWNPNSTNVFAVDWGREGRWRNQYQQRGHERLRITRDPKCEKLIVFSESCQSLFQAQN